jgi:hypothetical protein
MQLPFTIAVEAPGRPALRRAARSPWAWLLLAGLIAAIGPSSRSRAGRPHADTTAAG